MAEASPPPVEQSGWLSHANTEKALNDNPQVKSDLEGMLRTAGDPRPAWLWLYDDLMAGDTNSQFHEITMRASGLFGNMLGPGQIPTNDPVSAPSGPASFYAPATTNDDTNILTQLKEMLFGIVGILGKPSSSVVNAPITNTSTTVNTSVDNSANYADYSVHNWTDSSVTNITQGFGFDELTAFMSRFPGFSSVPSGGNGVISPSQPAAGYGQNVAQSGPRLGGQTIASVGGLELNTGGIGIGSTGIPWKTVILGVVASLLAMYIFKRFAK
jgi:hypothetical protein